MTAATLGGVAVSRLRLQVPAWGVWWADVDTVEDSALEGAVDLVVGGVTYAGTVVGGGVHAGRGRWRVAAGAGTWGRELPAKGYSDAAGVFASVPMLDAAGAVGETLRDVPIGRVGKHYARRAAPASSVLNDLAPRGWYVGADGVTRIGARASSVYAGDAPRVRVDPALGVIELAVEALAGLEPGLSVDGSAPATDVEVELDGSRLTARVYATAPTSERLEAYRAIVDGLDPRRVYRGVTEYRVVTQSGDALNLQPVRASSGLPDLARVPVRLAPGVSATHTLGSLVLVAFADSDPSRPAVIAGDAAGAPGWAPIDVTLEGLTGVALGSAPRLGVARQTDAVVAGPFAGTITFASARVKAGL